MPEMRKLPSNSIISKYAFGTALRMTFGAGVPSRSGMASDSRTRASAFHPIADVAYPARVHTIVWQKIAMQPWTFRLAPSRATIAR